MKTFRVKYYETLFNIINIKGQIKENRMNMNILLEAVLQIRITDRIHE